jgi:hypothetical protein
LPFFVPVPACLLQPHTTHTQGAHAQGPGRHAC